MTRTQSVVYVAGALLTTLLPIGSSAHHSVAAWFERGEFHEIEGVITEVRWQNPHILFFVRAPNADGEVVDWEIETNSIAGVQRWGINETLFNIGDRVVVSGWSSQRGLDNIYARNVLLSSGTELAFGTEPIYSDDVISSNERLEVSEGVAADAERWWLENGVASFSARSTGIMYEFARAEDAIAFGQLSGLAFAFLTVAVLLLLMLGSFRLAIIALIPNVIPIAMCFGMMGLLGIPLDAGTVVIGNLAFGIAVDDSIHAVTGFFDRWKSGDTSAVALRETYRTVGPPLIYTTAVVSLGFLVLAFSDFTFIRHLGILTAGLMILCLLADLFLLPALLSYLKPRPESVSVRE